MKYFKRILFVLFGVVALYISALSMFSIYYKDDIEQKVIIEINKHLTKPVLIDKISISVFSNFPSVSLDLYKMSLAKSDSSNKNVVSIGELQILFSPLYILIKEFHVDKIIISDGFIDVRVDSLGNKDFDIFVKKDSTKKKSHSLPSFSIDKIKINNFSVFYENKFKPKRFYIKFDKTISNLNIDAKTFTGGIHGDVFSNEVTLKSGTLFKKSQLNLDFNFAFNFETKLFSINDSQIISNGNIYVATGSLDLKNESLLTLNVKTKQADIQNVFGLLSEKWIGKLKPFNFKGHVNADATFKVSLLPDRQPIFSIDFDTKDFSMSNKNIHAKIHTIAFEGNLNSNNSFLVEEYSINLKNLLAHINLDGTLEAKAVSFINFKDPILTLNAQLKLPGQSIFDLVDFKEYSTVSGRLAVDVTYDGKFSYLFGKKSETPKLYGSINLKHLMVKLKKVHFAFDELDGLIKFRNDTINLENLFVRSGKSDLRVTGMAHNLFNSIFNDTTGLKMNINFVSNNFYFNDFNSSATKSKKEISKTKKAPSTIDVVDGNRFHLPYGIEASMSGIVKNFYAKNFHGQNIELKMDLTNQKVSFIETMNSFGGKLSFKTEFTPVNSKIHCKSNINMKNFHIDKVFSAFNDFKQSILTSKNVKGVVSGKVYSFFKMNSNLAVDTNSIYVKGDYSIRKFELMNVEPIMKLEKVGFEENDLKRVTFENINSTIEFSKNELTIPRTLFVSNILYFYLDVKVKDDGESVINILLPIKNMKKKPQTDGLTNDSKAGLSIPIKIVGKSGKLKVL